MAKHSNSMWLTCHYEQPDNTVSDIAVQNMADGEWQDFELGFHQPAGFLIFTYAILNCQHMYMRLNATERGLVLESADACIETLADDDWSLQKLHIRFEVRLKSGSPSPEDIEYISNRMQHCPVSMNLKEVPDSRVLLNFV